MFVRRVAQSDPYALQAVLDAGVLDIYVCLHISDFAGMQSITSTPDPSLLQLFDACNENLLLWLSVPEGFRTISHHHIYALWSRHAAYSFPEWQEATSGELRMIWELLGTNFIEFRLTVIESGLDTENKYTGTTAHCADALIFSR